MAAEAASEGRRTEEEEEEEEEEVVNVMLRYRADPEGDREDERGA